MKTFNTTAVCIPSKHYMVDLSGRVKEIKKLIDDGKYFTINCARQYGKTTTLNALRSYLSDEYIVLFIDFQGIGKEGFATENAFVSQFCRLIWNRRKTMTDIPSDLMEQIDRWRKNDRSEVLLGDLFDLIAEWCERSDKKIVLMIDEVDSASDSQVFLDFLGLLRDGYISHETDNTPAFQSVILAGVTDIRHLRSRIRDDEQHKVNSPWNIAADFDIDMSLSEEGICGMLEEYEEDHHTGMDTAFIARELRAYTGGYPFLVSRLCQLMDAEVSKRMPLSSVWTMRGIDEAVKMILSENNTLFQSLTGKLTNYPELKAAVRSILMEGTRLTYNPLQEEIRQMEMYGLICNDHGTVRVSNRIFETLLYNLFLSEEELKNNVFSREGSLSGNAFVQDGILNMRLILEKFIETYIQVMGPLKDRFSEKDGRELFLLYLKPIINGTGNYYIEAQTRDQTRTDVIVDYLGKQYILEMKIWRGPRYNEEGEKQIIDYLDYWNLDTGYMLSFNFNRNKETGVRRVQIRDKVLYEGTL